MYIRTISRKNKDGSQATYVQLAHNERDATTSQAKATVLYNFGRLESFDVEQLKRLVKSISRFLPPQAALESQVLLKPRQQLQMELDALIRRRLPAFSVVATTSFA
jgi:hypothetical protein